MYADKWHVEVFAAGGDEDIAHKIDAFLGEGNRKYVDLKIVVVNEDEFVRAFLVYAVDR